MNKNQITQNTWNKNAALYQEKFMDLHLYDDTYNLFCDLLKDKNPVVLEVGCGPGNITRYLKDRRPEFKMIAVDFAPNMIALASFNNPTVEFRLMDCRDISKIEKKFHGIICGFCIPYLDESECSKFFADCFDLLVDDGLLYFSAIEGNYSDSKYELSGTGDKCFVYYYSECDFNTALSKYNCNIIQCFRKEYDMSNGSKQIHLVFILQKKNKKPL